MRKKRRRKGGDEGVSGKASEEAPPFVTEFFFSLLSALSHAYRHSVPVPTPHLAATYKYIISFFARKYSHSREMKRNPPNSWM